MSTLAEVVEQVPHKRKRTGMKPSRPGTYVQFNYACVPDCPRCALQPFVERDAQLAALLRALKQHRIHFSWPDTSKSGIPVEIYFSVEKWKEIERLTAVLAGQPAPASAAQGVRDGG